MQDDPELIAHKSHAHVLCITRRVQSKTAYYNKKRGPKRVICLQRTGCRPWRSDGNDTSAPGVALPAAGPPPKPYAYSGGNAQSPPRVAATKGPHLTSAASSTNGITPLKCSYRYDYGIM